MRKAKPKRALSAYGIAPKSRLNSSPTLVSIPCYSELIIPESKTSKLNWRNRFVDRPSNRVPRLASIHVELASGEQYQVLLQ